MPEKEKRCRSHTGMFELNVGRLVIAVIPSSQGEKLFLDWCNWNWNWNYTCKDFLNGTNTSWKWCFSKVTERVLQICSGFIILQYIFKKFLDKGRFCYNFKRRWLGSKAGKVRCDLDKHFISLKFSKLICRILYGRD